MRFLLLAVNFLIQGFKKIFSPILFNLGRGYTLKKSSFRLVDIFKSIESVGLPASTLGGRVFPYPQVASRQTN